MLQHDKVTLSYLVFHQTLQSSTQRIKKVPGPRLHFLRREEPDPSESGYDSTGFEFIGEFNRLLDTRDKIAGRVLNLNSMITSAPYARFRSGRSTDGLLGNLRPGQVAGQPLLDGGVEPTKVNKSLDELWEALVPHSPANHRLSFRDIIPFPERDRVTVGIGDKRVSGRDEVRLSDAHELATRNIELLPARNVRGRVQEGKQNTPRRPREFVTEGVARALWGR